MNRTLYFSISFFSFIFWTNFSYSQNKLSSTERILKKANSLIHRSFQSKSIKDYDNKGWHNLYNKAFQELFDENPRNLLNENLWKKVDRIAYSNSIAQFGFCHYQGWKHEKISKKYGPVTANSFLKKFLVDLLAERSIYDPAIISCLPFIGRKKVQALIEELFPPEKLVQMKGTTRVVELLLSFHFDGSHRLPNGSSLIAHLAPNYGSKVLDEFLDRGVSIESKDNLGNTLIHILLDNPETFSSIDILGFVKRGPDLGQYQFSNTQYPTAKERIIVLLEKQIPLTNEKIRKLKSQGKKQAYIQIENEKLKVLRLLKQEVE